MLCTDTCFCFTVLFFPLPQSHMDMLGKSFWICAAYLIATEASDRSQKRVHVMR